MTPERILVALRNTKKQPRNIAQVVKSSFNLDCEIDPRKKHVRRSAA